ncbi:MAG TPA: hypothetical protein VJV05_08405 [Pyrinomonadaceae bacterium]|nr:hypothetical protein [Pyrinomonadaceae bacterium]
MKVTSAFLFTLILLTAAFAQNKPAIEFESLMTMRFYEATGDFLVEGLEVVFPPTGAKSATFEITRSTGGVVAKVPLRMEPLAAFPAFAILKPASGNPGNAKVGQAGDFLMTVKIDGTAITTMPFSLKQEVSADPFAPGSKWVRSGAWSDLAFFAALPDDPTARIEFNWWMSTRELAAGMKAPKVTIHLLSNGKEIAASRGPVVPDTLDWYFYERKEMIMETQPKQKWLTVGDLTKLNGEIALVVKANGQPVKTFKTQVQGGVIQRLAENKLGYEPQTKFISPRYVDTTDRSRSDFTMRDMFWMKKN